MQDDSRDLLGFTEPAQRDETANLRDRGILNQPTIRDVIMLKITMMLGSFDRLLGKSNMAQAIDVARIVDQAGLYERVLIPGQE